MIYNVTYIFIWKPLVVKSLFFDYLRVSHIASCGEVWFGTFALDSWQLHTLFFTCQP
jgi:hypothetical protein